MDKILIIITIMFSLLIGVFFYVGFQTGRNSILNEIENSVITKYEKHYMGVDNG